MIFFKFAVGELSCKRRQTNPRSGQLADYCQLAYSDFFYLYTKSTLTLTLPKVSSMYK